MWNKDEIKGKGKQIEGAIKNKTGKLIGNPNLEAKGEAERLAGKVQEKTGEARRKAGDAVVTAAKAIRAVASMTPDLARPTTRASIHHAI